LSEVIPEAQKNVDSSKSKYRNILEASRPKNIKDFLEDAGMAQTEKAEKNAETPKDAHAQMKIPRETQEPVIEDHSPKKVRLHVHISEELEQKINKKIYESKLHNRHAGRMNKTAIIEEALRRYFESSA